MAAKPSTARSTVRRPGRGRRCPSRVGRWEVAGGPQPPGWVGAAAAARAAERPGRPGRCAERPSRAAVRWARERADGWQPPRGWASLGWVLDHGGWSSPRLTPGWAAPEGLLEVPAGMGVRPQRGPSRQRALPARCRQRSDLRKWGVGLPGLEPPASSLSGIEGSALCARPFSQVAGERQGRRDAFKARCSDRS